VLRVGPEKGSTISISCEASCEHADVGDCDPRFCYDGLFEVLGQPAASTKPCEGPLDDPAARQDFKTLGLVGTFDDFECPFPDFLQPLFQLVARIAAIGEDMKQPWPSVPDGFQEIRSAVAILNIGTMHHEADNQPECIDDDVALATLDLSANAVCRRLASIKASDTTAFSGFDALASVMGLVWSSPFSSPAAGFMLPSVVDEMPPHHTC
jgi:hypothetical protein